MPLAGHIIMSYRGHLSWSACAVCRKYDPRLPSGFIHKLQSLLRCPQITAHIRFPLYSPNKSWDLILHIIFCPRNLDQLIFPMIVLNLQSPWICNTPDHHSPFLTLNLAGKVTCRNLRVDQFCKHVSICSNNRSDPINPPV